MVDHSVVQKCFTKQLKSISQKKVDVKNYLMKQSSYTQNRQTRDKFKTQKVIVGGINELHQADLIDVQAYATENNGVRFILLVIDTFSKKNNQQKKLTQCKMLLKKFILNIAHFLIL